MKKFQYIGWHVYVLSSFPRWSEINYHNINLDVWMQSHGVLVMDKSLFILNYVLTVKWTYWTNMALLSWSPVELHCISQHPSGHSPALHHNHSHLTSIRESSSPVATNQALYKTHSFQTLIVCSRGYKFFICLFTNMLDRCECHPPVDSTKGRYSPWLCSLVNQTERPFWRLRKPLQVFWIY